MRFIQSNAYSLAKTLQVAQNESHERRRIYYYGFQIIVGALVKGIALITLSLVLGIFVPVMVIATVFASLRVLAGGYHMDTYGKCIATSIGLFLLAGLAAQYLPWGMQSSLISIGIAFLYGIYCVGKYAPRDTPNKPITDPQEQTKFKRLSFTYLAAWVIIISAVSIFGWPRLAVAASFGLILESFTLTILGHRFFDKISGR